MDTETLVIIILSSSFALILLLLLIYYACQYFLLINFTKINQSLNGNQAFGQSPAVLQPPPPVGYSQGKYITHIPVIQF